MLARNDAAMHGLQDRRRLAAQFHPEVDEQQLERWLDAHTDTETRRLGIDADQFLADTDPPASGRPADRSSPPRSPWRDGWTLMHGRRRRTQRVPAGLRPACYHNGLMSSRTLGCLATPAVREDRGWNRGRAWPASSSGRPGPRGDTSLPGTDNISHNIYRWERGAVTPAERYKLLYCSAFGIPFSQFGTALPPGMVDASPAVPAASAYGGTPPERGASAIRREVLMAANEGSEHADRAEQRGVGEITLEQLRADVTGSSVQYMTAEPYRLFPEMRRVRDRIIEMLDRRQMAP